MAINDLSSQSLRIQNCLDRLRGGDEGARDQLFTCACDRLTRLTRKMLAQNPRVRRWEETPDVMQNASLRLCRALESVVPKTAREFFGLAAEQIRRELIDLARRYYGPHGIGANHSSQIRIDPLRSNTQGVEFVAADSSGDPRALIDWVELHECVGSLPPEEREVFGLLWYHGLSQDEAATVLNVSERTVRRYWQSARIRLHDKLGDSPLQM